MPLPLDQMRRVAGFELNALRVTGVIGEEFDRIRVPARGTPIHDLNGTVLFHRLPLNRGRRGTGYADIAVDEAMGEPLLGVSMGVAWDEAPLLKSGAAKARRIRPGLKYDRVRFVAYSYPKIALQFLLDDDEALMLELYSWAVVPPARRLERRPFEPSNFERWSLLDEMPAELRRSRTRSFAKRLRLWEGPALNRIDPRTITAETLRLPRMAIKLVDSREIHYSSRNTDHHPCYELRGQQTNVWCVAASVEMLLNFYRYSYDQARLAADLGLGTVTNPNGLPYSRDGDVVTVMENLTSNALDVTMHSSPAWSLYRTEIRGNRPLISFIPGHARTVAGYTQTMLHLWNQIPLRGLLVYDPWPPTTGVITRWENFNTQTYRLAFSCVLRHI